MLRSLILFYIIVFVNSQSTLRFAQIWFRHGERLPTHYLQFARDPPSDAYLQIGEAGELTMRGIRREYGLGMMLREKYGEFLGEYTPSKLHTYTGKDNRTVTSAQAMMAGLFPPSSTKQWSTDLLWQPVSMHTDDSVDWVSTGIETVCPKYEKNFFSSPDYKAIPGQLDQEVLTFLRNATGGIPRDDVVDINRVIDSLRVRNFLNDSRLAYPSWAEPIKDKLDGVLFKLHSLVLNLQNGTVGGNHLERVLSYMEDHLQRPHQSMNKAVFIAGHDTNLMAIGKAFGLPDLQEKLPFYGGHLAVELHLLNGDHVVKFLYSNGTGVPPVEVSPTYCPQPCSLTRLQQLAEGLRFSNANLLRECNGLVEESTVTPITFGVLLALATIFLISTVILGCSARSYKKQLRDLQDPERQRLL